MSERVKAPCRLFGILARQANVGILLRRGPSKWVRLIKWFVGEDRFEFGQWFKGRVYEDRCDLSPSGRLLIYFASKINERTLADSPSFLETIWAIAGLEAGQSSHYTYAWTAVSKPPWFTALALWPKGDCWRGGGLFEDESTVRVNHSPTEARPHPNHLPSQLTVQATSVASELLRSERLKRDGWVLEQEGEFIHSSKSGYRTIQEEVYGKLSRGGEHDLLMMHTLMRYKHSLTFRVRSKGNGSTTELGEATWSDWDQCGRLICAKDGKLLHYRLEGDSFVPRLIHDFNADRPQAIPPSPEALSWE